MVFYFYTNDSKGLPWEIYMGRDEVENEDLIKYGCETDVWFHVDDLSSAHVYLICRPGYSYSTIPPEILEDCAQLVKANSIKGVKMSSVKVVYTPWSNLLKRGDMKTGQIGFHSNKEMKYTTIDKKNVIVNRLVKTRAEKPTSSIRERRDAYERSLRNAEKQAKIAIAASEKASKDAAAKKKAEMDEFADLFNDSSNKMFNNNMGMTAEEYENDFI